MFISKSFIVLQLIQLNSKNPEIKQEVKIIIEINENENTTTPSLLDTVKAVLRGRFIAIQAYLKKKKKEVK